VARLAASARLKELDPAEASSRRSAIDREPLDQLAVLPPGLDGETGHSRAVRKVPQTFAAGWGGVGAVAWRASVDSMSALRAPSVHEAGAADAADHERYLSESMSQIMSDLSGLLAQADDVNRGVETLAREAQRAVESPRYRTLLLDTLAL
jgi:hypothetical protein